MFKKSLYFDLQILQIKPLSLAKRFGFIFKKYLALMGLILHKTVTLQAGLISMKFKDASGIGTAQSSIVDFYNDIVTSEIIKKKRPIIVDVGANIGQFCNAAKLFFPEASVYSFEPDPTVYKELQHNTDDLKSVRLFNLGMGDKKDKLKFYIHNLSGMSSFKKYASHKYDKDHILYLDINKLDNIISPTKRIDLLKIDVEGFELNVLKGALKTMERTDYLLLELSLERDMANDTNIKLLSFLYSNFPAAKIIKFGRPLGNPSRPSCQDVLIKLREVA